MIREVNRDEIPKKRSGRPKGAATICAEEFLESGYDACEVDVPSGRSPASFCACMHKTVKRLDLPVAMMVRDGRIFLVKKEPSDG